LIEAVAKIGEYSLQKEGKNPDTEEGLIDILAQPINSTDAYKHVITIEVDISEKPAFKRVGLDELDEKKRTRYLYRKGSSRGTDVTPIALITKPERTFPNKIMNWLNRDYSNPLFELAPDEVTFLNAIKETIEENRESILDEIGRKVNGLTSKEKAVLSLKFLRETESLYLGDLSLFKKIFRIEALAQFSSSNGVKSVSANKLCSICTEKSDEVYGFVAPWAFYTVDKPGFVTGGGFNQAEAWRCNPICRRCALQLMEGKTWLDYYSTFKFYGLQYLLIPRPLLPGVEVYNIVEKYYEKSKGKTETLKLSARYSKLLDAREREVLKELGDQNAFNCDILVFEKLNNAFRILSLIEGVFPSRLKELFDAKNRTEEKLRSGFNVLFTDQTTKAQFEFNFGSFWYFFGKEKYEPDMSGYFLDLVGRIFQGQKVSYPLILWGVMEKIRNIFGKNYKEKHPTREATLKAWASLIYLQELGILNEYSSSVHNELNEGMICLDADEKVKVAEEFFGKYPEFFDTDDKKATFLVGSLCQLVMNIQWNDGKRPPPFMAKLQGLRLDQKRVQSLLPEVENKFREYEKTYYRGLERLASEYFVKAKPIWKMSRDEVSFYFVTGMNLSCMFGE